jgi:hypothetical protein
MTRQAVAALALILAAWASAVGADRDAVRTVAVTGTAIAPGTSGTVAVAMTGDGAENAVGFSLTFDPTQLTYVSATVGSGSSAAALVVNDLQSSSGRIGVLLTLPAGQTWPAGTRDLVIVTLSAPEGADTTASVGFGDTPVLREVVSASASVLEATFVGGVVITSPRVVSITSDGLRRGQRETVGVALIDTGVAGAVGLSVAFDPAELTFVSAATGAGAGGASLLTNDAQKGAGRVGLLLTLPAGQAWPAGTRELALVTFDVAPGSVSGTTALSFADTPIMREVVDVAASVLPSAFRGVTVALEASVSPVITGGPANRTITAGQTTTFAVVAEGNPAPTYQWQVSTNGGTSFTNLTDGAPYSGTTSATLTVTEATTSLNGARYRAVVTNTVASATSDAATLTVRGNATASPASLRFAAVRRGVSLTVTTAQQVTVTFAGAGSSWTATSTVPWLVAVPGGGSGAGTFEVVLNPDAIPAEGASHTGSMTISTPQAPTTSVTIPVVLTVTTETLPPVGQVDTPSQDSTGLQGAIGVTGWVLDDIGVASVKIYRNCLDFDNPASCQTVLADTPQEANVVYIGDAAFLAGARTDVEGGFPEYPAANRAGWGYLLLTSMLPHGPNRAGFGGQGPLTLYAVATDVDGHTILLGRSAVATDPSHTTPTRITMDNDGIGKPFGAIDTPGQGATVGGILANFGWALTPDRNRTAGDPDDIAIPIDGSTMTVFLDGAPIAQVTYNQCRGSVGNPPPVGVFCDDDVANIFGQTTPQPVLTVRGANPTYFRNLDAGRAAIGSFAIDTRTLSNGRHTIAWSVTDSAGRTEGIGSRFFYVLNGTTDAPVTVTLPTSVVPETTVNTPTSVAGDSIARRAALVTDARMADVPPGTIWVRTGFDLRTPWRTLLMTESGPPEIALDQLGRLELWLGAPVTDAWLVGSDEERRPLPVGLQITGAQVTWAPPAGYLGAYTLALMRDGQRVDVRVVVR